MFALGTVSPAVFIFAAVTAAFAIFGPVTARFLICGVPTLFKGSDVAAAYVVPARATNNAIMEITSAGLGARS